MATPLRMTATDPAGEVQRLIASLRTRGFGGEGNDVEPTPPLGGGPGSELGPGKGQPGFKPPWEPDWTEPDIGLPATRPAGALPAATGSPMGNVAALLSQPGRGGSELRIPESSSRPLDGPAGNPTFGQGLRQRMRGLSSAPASTAFGGGLPGGGATGGMDLNQLLALLLGSGGGV